jgi:hypothetical protein
VRVLLVAAVVAVVAGCGAPAGEVPPAGLGATDQAYVDLVIPQNESVLAVLELTASRPRSAVRPLAARVGARYRDELARLRELLAVHGKP